MDYGDHISLSTYSQPSILEVTAQESLLNTLLPAFQHLVKVVGGQVRWVAWVDRHCSTEVFTVLHAALQHHCLKTHGASFAEHFYDLKRININTHDVTNKPKQTDSFTSQHATKTQDTTIHSTSLSSLLKILSSSNPLLPLLWILPRQSSHYRSVAVLVLLPYLHHKITEAYLEAADATHQHPQSTIGRVKATLLRLWPFMHAAVGLLNLIYYVRYLTGTSKVCSLKHHLSGVTLRRVTPEEFELEEERDEASSMWERWSRRGPSLLLDGVEFGAFFLQFLDWFYSSDTVSHSVVSSLGGPVAPLFPHKLKDPSESPAMDGGGLCPVCGRQMKQPTALAVSGYVFCYSCVLTSVRREAKCPVTGYPATTGQLIRVYHD